MPNFPARLIIEEENRPAATAYQPKFATLITVDRIGDALLAEYRPQPDPQIDAVARREDNGQAFDQNPYDIEAEDVDQHPAEGQILGYVSALCVTPGRDGETAGREEKVKERVLTILLQHRHDAGDRFLPDIVFFVCHSLNPSKHAGNDKPDAHNHRYGNHRVIGLRHLFRKLIGIGLQFPAVSPSPHRSVVQWNPVSKFSLLMVIARAIVILI